MPSEEKLTPEAREAIRGFVFRICVPIGGAGALLSFVVGFAARELGVALAQSQAQAAAQAQVVQLVAETARSAAKAVSDAENAAKTAERAATASTETASKLTNTAQLGRVVGDLEKFKAELARQVATQQVVTTIPSVSKRQEVLAARGVETGPVTRREPIQRATSSHICVLSGLRVANIDDDGEGFRCSVVLDDGKWFIESEASEEKRGSSQVSCSASCFSLSKVSVNQ